MSRFIDYDAARAETQCDPVVVRAFGRDWSLYSALPARVVFDIVRAQASGQQEFSTQQAMDLIARLVPEQVLDAWLDAGMVFDDTFNALVQNIMRAYMSGPDEEPAEGKAAAAGLRDFSTAGDSSKPTSSASTASI